MKKEKETETVQDQYISELLHIETLHRGELDLSTRKIAEMLNLGRTTIRRRLAELDRLRELYPKDARLVNKSILPGQAEPKDAIVYEGPKSGKVKRYILTSAQNNTKLHAKFWNNLIAFSKFVDAEILVGTYTYSHNNNSEFTVKRGTNQHHSDVWWDERITPYIVDDRVELANGLIWCGDWNISPTAEDPVANLDSYHGPKSNIFPHSKVRQKSIAVQKGERVKRNMTTGSVTQLNYVQRKAGMKAEFDHIFGAIIVEVDSTGFWLHRQIIATADDGSFYDIDISVKDGVCSLGSGLEAIIHGDIHAEQCDPDVFFAVFAPGGIVDTLKPKVQTIHDLLDFKSRNHHEKNSIFSEFEKWANEEDSVEAEMCFTANVLEEIVQSTDAETYVLYSNHDDQIHRWLNDPQNDFRKDFPNAIYYLELMLMKLRSIADGYSISLWKEALKMANSNLEDLEDAGALKFLTSVDDTLMVSGIEIGKHGHVGISGSKGSLASFSKSGQKTVIGHVHKAEIDKGAWSVGTYQTLYPKYAQGLCNWTHSCCLIYPNGKRTLIDIERNSAGELKWRL